MKKFDLVRAWKDSAYRNRLDAAQQAVSASPAGVADLDAALVDAIGGGGTASNNGCHSGHLGGGGSTWCLICVN
jgi:mersacidin/lichenicidin family type 2 lantibiotic